MPTICRTAARATTILATLLVAALPAPAHGQTACERPLLSFAPPREPVALTERQEVDLGDAIAEHVQREFQVVHDETNEYLQTIGDRIVRELPPSDFDFRFVLITSPS